MNLTTAGLENSPAVTKRALRKKGKIVDYGSKCVSLTQKRGLEKMHSQPITSQENLPCSSKGSFGP